MQVEYHTCCQVEILCHVLLMLLNPATYSLGEAWYGDGSLRLKELPDLCLTQGAIAH